MIWCWVLLAVAAVLCPLPRRAEMRLRRLQAASRLADRLSSAPRRASERDPAELTPERGPERLATVPQRSALPAVSAAALAAMRWRRVQPPGPTLRLWLGVAGLAGAVTGLVADAASGVAVATVLAAIGWTWHCAPRRRLEGAHWRALAAALRLLCAELAAGSAVSSAFAAAAPVAGVHRPAFAAAAAAAAEGTDVAAALEAHGSAELRPLTVAWRVIALTGSAPVDVLRRVDDDVAGQLAQRRDVAASTAGARSSAALLAGLPGIGVVLGSALGARPLALLLGTPAGHLLLCAGALLDGLGLAWTARLIAGAQRS